MDQEKYKKIETECSVCKTKFDIWLETVNYTEEMEQNIRENVFRYCPVCRAMEKCKEIKEKKERS